MARFAQDAEDRGFRGTLAAPVPVITDHASLRALTQFPGLHLPPDLVDEVFASTDPSRAGIDAAVSFGRRVLASGRFAHVNLSGRATSSGQLARSHVMADVVRGLTESL